LALPEGSLARNEPISKQRLKCTSTEVLDVALRVGNQNLFDEVWPAGKKDSSRPNSKTGERSVLFRQIEQKAKSVTAETLQTAAQ
jgi:hypothetical protein